MNITTNRNTLLAIIAAIVLIFFVTRPAAADGPADCANIQTDKGTVTGVAKEKEKLCVYRGIPYAAPPVGDLRFALPAEHAPWSETLKAENFGNDCMQTAMSLIPSDKLVGSEDCLYLNIMSPMSAAQSPKPVMVFLHGGGFIYGAGSWDIYRGTGLTAIGDVIVVTINYRLGPFGFLVHPALKDPAGYQGNYGMWDQVAALKWVRKNIKNFGGDPNNVTIFGESAGGASVGLLLLSPEAAPLFQKGIIESGPVLIVEQDVAAGEKIGLAAAEKAGCPDVKTAAGCLRKMDAEKIFRGMPSGIFFMTGEEANASFPFSPIADGKLIPDLPYRMLRKGDFPKDKKVMIGSNHDEASYFIAGKKLDTPDDFRKTLQGDSKIMKNALGLDIDATKVMNLYPLDAYPTPRKAYSDVFTDMAFTCTTRAHANQIVAQRKDGVYLYFFTKKPQESGPFVEWGAFHGVELAYIFNNFVFMGMKFPSAANTRLARKVIAYWSSFARDGVPSGDGLPVWPLYDPKTEPYIQLDNDITVGTNLRTDKCKFFEAIFDEAFSKK